MQHYYDANGSPMRTRLIAYITSINKLGSLVPVLFNAVVTNPFISGIMKKMMGFARERSIPVLGRKTVRKWARKNLPDLNPNGSSKGSVSLFLDEFTNYNDIQVGEKAIKLLTKLGYKVNLPKHNLSGRTFMSKGLLRSARKIAIKNVELLGGIISEENPLIRPGTSAILGFRDEYPVLVGDA